MNLEKEVNNVLKEWRNKGQYNQDSENLALQIVLTDKIKKYLNIININNNTDPEDSLWIESCIESLIKGNNLVMHEYIFEQQMQDNKITYSVNGIGIYKQYPNGNEELVLKLKTFIYKKEEKK